MTKASTDTLRRVFENNGTHFVEVGPHPENVGWVELRTIEGKFSADFYGSINLALTPDFARELGEALIAAADECAP